MSQTRAARRRATARTSRAPASRSAPAVRRRAPPETADSPAPGRTAAPCRSRGHRRRRNPGPTATLRASARYSCSSCVSGLSDPVEEAEGQPQREADGRRRERAGGARACRRGSSRLLTALEAQRRDLLGDEADEEHDDGEHDEQDRRVGDVALRRDRPGRVGRAERRTPRG